VPRTCCSLSAMQRKFRSFTVLTAALQARLTTASHLHHLGCAGCDARSGQEQKGDMVRWESRSTLVS
jgi:hypothetical protein